ncbi:MAG: ABC transporter permease [Acidobacteria bacterium]|nr:ABC transporter permease [Acidobacteriota bacterium]
MRVWRSGDPPDAGQFTNAVSFAGDFFDISGLRLLRGRALTRADAAATTAVVVVNEAFITRFALTEPVVGRPLRISFPREEDAAPRHVTIVGVASQPAGLGGPMGEDPTMYLPLGTSPDYIAAWLSADNAVQMWMQSAAPSRISIRSCPRWLCARSRTTTSKTTSRCG